MDFGLLCETVTSEIEPFCRFSLALKIKFEVLTSKYKLLMFSSNFLLEIQYFEAAAFLQFSKLFSFVEMYIYEICKNKRIAETELYIQWKKKKNFLTYLSVRMNISKVFTFIN